jgi:FkbM family methyltransferase
LLKPESVFLDIGCNIGWYTLLSASILKRGKVIGFEPLHQNLQLLYKSIHENSFENVVIYPFAASDTNSLIQIGGHAAFGFVKQADGSNAEFAQAYKLDDLLVNEDKIDLIKMDIEGHEPLALAGMLSIIAKHKPVIISEFNPRAMQDFARQNPLEYLTTLIRLDYQLFVIGKDSIISFKTPGELFDYWHQLDQANTSDDPVYLDIVASPNEKPAILNV